MLAVHLHEGQKAAYASEARVVVMSAGTQGGKTSFGPLWLLREMRRRGPGDYLIVTPTFAMLERKLLGEVVRLFDSYLRLGKYIASPTRRFRFSREGERRIHKTNYDPDRETTIQFGYAEYPESLESMTAQAAWSDEAGQWKFKREAYEAVERRLAVTGGRHLITTSLYRQGWLTDLIAQARQDQSLDVVQFDSLMNPNYDLTAFERARRTLPRSKFDMLYRGLPARPEGLVYSNYDPRRHLVKPFPIPDAWPRFVGLDFGPVHTAAVFIAKEPLAETEPVAYGGRLYVYRTYLAGHRTARQHTHELRAGEPMPVRITGGAWSENDWRDEFNAAGYPVARPAVREVEVGIQRVMACFASGTFHLFDDLDALKEEIISYARVVDEAGLPTDEIADKSSYHLLDALRYCALGLEEVEPASVTEATNTDRWRDATSRF